MVAGLVNSLRVVLALIALSVALMAAWTSRGWRPRPGGGVTPIVLRRGDDLRTLADQAVDAGADVIGMAGGDGSQALVADVARRHDLPLVCVPAGTRNHFALGLDLGLDRADVAAALAAYGDAVERGVRRTGLEAGGVRRTGLEAGRPPATDRGQRFCHP